MISTQKKILVVIFIIFNYIGIAQTINYKISSNKSSIGNITVSKITNSNVTQIEVVSEVRVKLYISIDLKYKLNSTFKDNELIFSSVTIYVNGKIHSKTITEKDKNYYSIIKNGHASRFLNKINYSGALLYFKEPENIPILFSEFHAVQKPIKKIGVNEYQITNPKNNHLSEYTYKNGVLEKAIIHHNLITFTLEKI